MTNSKYIYRGLKEDIPKSLFAYNLIPFHKKVSKKPFKILKAFLLIFAREVYLNDLKYGHLVLTILEKYL